MLPIALFFCWPLLAIAIVAVLCRLVHNAKVTDRALQIRRPERNHYGRRIKGRDAKGGSNRRAA